MRHTLRQFRVVQAQDTGQPYHCTCADFTWRQRACKHVLACQALYMTGKIRATTPR